MRPTVIRFPPSAKLGEPHDAEVILFPRFRGLVTDLLREWHDRGYQVSANTRGQMVVKKASRATVFFNRFRRKS